MKFDTKEFHDDKPNPIFLEVQLQKNHGTKPLPEPMLTYHH